VTATTTTEKAAERSAVAQSAFDDIAKCGAPKRRNPEKGRPCSYPAGYRTEHPGVGHCYLHGGRARQQRIAGVVEIARRELAMRDMILPINSHDALLRCIEIAWSEVTLASEAITRLDPEEVMAPVESTHERPRREEGGSESMVERVTERKLEGKRIHEWYVFRHEAMDRATKYSKMAIEARLDERRVALAERQGEAVLAAVRTAIAAFEQLFKVKMLDHPDAPRILRQALLMQSSEHA